MTRIRRNETHLGTNGNGNGLSLGAEDQLGSAGVEEVQLVRVAAHSGVVLLDEEPAHLILGDVALVIGWGVGGRSGGLGRLEVGRSVHSGMGVVERVGVGMLRRVAAVQRSLGHIGHDDGGVLVLALDCGGKRDRNKVTEGVGNNRRPALEIKKRTL